MDGMIRDSDAHSLFISYAPQDEALLHALEKHLKPLHRQGLITTWHHRKVLAGVDWQEALDTQLQHACIILLLISIDFLDSEYCYGVEMQRALERHKTGEAFVIPVLLRPAYLQGAPFGHLQCLPRNEQAISEWQDQDRALREVVAEIHATWRRI